MVELFLCHALEDRHVAAAIAQRLERNGVARARLEEGQLAPGKTAAEDWELGLGAGAILVLLSPDAAPARGGREAWQALLEHAGEPPVGALLVRDCRYPPLLDKRRFYRWQGDGVMAQRAIEQWLVELWPRSGAGDAFSPAPLPWFRGRELELALLWETLVDRPGKVVLTGPAGCGKSALAQEFARRASPHFHTVACRGEPQGRALLVVDRADEAPAVPAGHVSVLATADDAAGWPADWRAIAIKPGKWEPLGRPSTAAAASLWRAMAVCAPGGFPLHLAAAVAQLPVPAAEEAAVHLVTAGLADPFDETGPRYRVSARSRAAAFADGGEEEWRRRHAAAITRPSAHAWPATEGERAFAWALAGDWDLAVKLGRRLLQRYAPAGRVECARSAVERLRAAAAARGDERVLGDCDWELSWIGEEPRWEGLRGASAPSEQLPLDFAGEHG